MSENQDVSDFFSILHHPPIGVFILNSEHKIVFWNKCLEDWTGILKNSILDTSIFNHFPHLDSPQFISRIKQVFEGGPPTIFSSQLHKYIIPIPHKKNEFRIQHTIVKSVCVPGKEECYALFTVQDVTDHTDLIQKYKEINKHTMQEVEERKKAEEELKSHKENLEIIVQERTDKLKETMSQLFQAEKLSALGESSASIAHDLNQPLNSITIICQSIIRDIMKEAVDNKDLEEDLLEIISSVDRMNNIINEMRNYSRFSEGNPVDNVDINNIIQGPLKLLAHRIKGLNIEIIFDLMTDMDGIKADPIRLEQVFMNIIMNAINSLEKSKTAEKIITIKTTIIDSSDSSIGKPAICVEITDNGQGIPDNIKDKIFKAFFTTSPPGKGTGLGLSISKKIIEEHNGKIEIISKKDEGVQFRITLPI